jgi:hypothetical protein
MFSPGVIYDLVATAMRRQHQSVPSSGLLLVTDANNLIAEEIYGWLGGGEYVARFLIRQVQAWKLCMDPLRP